MAFGSFDKGADAPMSEINTTPLVDVMLVLLVVFIITAPLLTNAVQVNLPQASASQHEDRPEAIRLAINAEGRLYWNDLPIEPGRLKSRFAEAAAANPLWNCTCARTRPCAMKWWQKRWPPPRATASAASAL